jgi:glycosyltransferase involved in cell wall biosynthesis
MSALPLVSVIIPSYNHAEFVAEALRTVLNQSHKNIEVIVVDDGSTDGTADVVAKTRDPRLHLIRFSKNREHHARNHALSFAGGRYVAFQNSDDVWNRDKISAQVELMEKQKQIAVSFTEVELIDPQGHVLENSWAAGLFTAENRSRLDWLRFFFYRGNCLCISSAFVRRDLLTQVGNFRPTLFNLSDFDLWVRLAAVGDIHIINQKLTSMRIIPHRNVSAPGQHSRHMFENESVEVLKRYASPPVLKDIPHIFPEIFPRKTYRSSVWKAGLAKAAWLSGTPYHIFFANQILSELLDDIQSRNKIMRYFGTQIIHDLINYKGRSIISVEEN